MIHRSQRWHSGSMSCICIVAMGKRSAEQVQTRSIVCWSTSWQ